MPDKGKSKGGPKKPKATRETKKNTTKDSGKGKKK